MAKMLGQDIFTQEEFDEFNSTSFLPTVDELRSQKLDRSEFSQFSSKTNKDINKLYIIVALITIINMAIPFIIIASTK